MHIYTHTYITPLILDCAVPQYGFTQRTVHLSLGLLSCVAGWIPPLYWQHRRGLSYQPPRGRSPWTGFRISRAARDFLSYTSCKESSTWWEPCWISYVPYWKPGGTELLSENVTNCTFSCTCYLLHTHFIKTMSFPHATGNRLYDYLLDMFRKVFSILLLLFTRLMRSRVQQTKNSSQK